MTGVRARRGVRSFVREAAVLGAVGLGLLTQAAAQNELLAEFDRAHATFSAAADVGQRQALASQVSDAFLRLPDGAGRASRLPAGAHATLAAGRAELALQLTDPAKSGDPQTDEVLLTVRLRALAQLDRLVEFARIVQKQAASEAKAVTDALRLEERRLLPLAAKALRTRDRPSGRLVFQHLATLEPIQSYRVANLGLCLRQIGDLEAAYQTYALGQRLSPNDLELWNDYGLLLRATGRWREALAAFRRSVALDLKRPGPLQGHGPAVTNLMHAEALQKGLVGGQGSERDPAPTAVLALEKRPNATLLRRLMLDLSLDRLTAKPSGK